MKQAIKSQSDAENIAAPEYDAIRPSERYYPVDTPYGFSWMCMKIAQLSGKKTWTNPNGKVEKFKRLWYIRYPIGNGKERKWLIGDLRTMSFDEACRQHAILAGRVRQGEDFVLTIREAKATAMAKPKSVAFHKVAADWLADKESSIKSRTWSQINSRLNLHILPFFKGRTVDTITSKDVVALRNKVYLDTPAMSTKVLSYMKQIMRYAFEHNLCEVNVAKFVDAKHKQVRRGEWFRDEDIKRIFARLDGGDIPTNIARATKLLCLSGLRRQNVVALRKSQVLMADTGGCILKFEGADMKMGKEFSVYLDSETTDKLIQPAIVDSGDSDYVFPAVRRGNSGHISPVNVSQKMKVVLDELGIKGRLHTWRSTMISNGSEFGLDSSILDACLAHSPTGTQAVYQNSWNYPAMSPVWYGWQKHVWSVVEGREQIVSADEKMLRLVK